MERSALIRRVAPVAVFAAVLGGLAALDAARDGTSPRGRSQRQLDPLPLGARAANGQDEATAARGTAGAGASTDAMYWRGEIVIPDRLLAGLPDEGPVHRVTPGDTSEDRITRLARALGVVGVVQRDAEGWYVRDAERTLRVYPQPGTPWHFGNDKGVVVGRPVTVDPAPPEEGPGATDPDDAPSGDPDRPVSDEPCEKEACDTPATAPCEPPTDGTEPACLPHPEPTKPPQPSDDEARATAQRVFDAVGIADPAVTINDAWSGKEVVGAPVVGGLPTQGFETRVTVELGGRVQYANGHLGASELKGDYPLMAPRDAVDRDGPYGQPRAAYDMACPEAEGEKCPTPEPREAKSLRLGLLFMTSYDPDEGAFLAPAWLLTFDDAATWAEPVLALPDEYLTPPPTGGPGGEVPPDGGEVPADSGSGGGSTGSTGTTGK